MIIGRNNLIGFHLEQVPPSFSSNNQSRCYKRGTKLFGNLKRRNSCLEKPSRFNDLSFCKCGFRLGMPVGATLLPSHIPLVVIFCSDPQVFRINTPRVVTGVKHEKRIRNSAVSQFKRKAMGSNRFTIYQKAAIPKSMRIFPRPTRFSFGDSIPKAHGWGWFRFASARERACNPYSFAVNQNRISADSTRNEMWATLRMHRDAFLFNHGVEARKLELRGPISLKLPLL